MTADKAKTEPANNGPPKNLTSKLLALYRALPGGAFLLAVVPLLVLGYFGWYYWGAEHLDRTLYSLKLDNIAISEPPPWIRANIKEEVYRNAGLSQVSLLDPQATATIAHAFSAHVWVHRASRVRKSGDGKVQVDLMYRKPAAMVYYESHNGGHLQGSGQPSADELAPRHKGFYPVDHEGIVLPTEDFVDKQVFEYFLIFASGATPGQVGMAFGDSRISEALELCRLLDSKREPWKLQRIYVNSDDSIRERSPWIFTLVTSDRREIVWGRAPGKEAINEASVQDKIARLERWLTSAAGNGSATSLDLRDRVPLGGRFTGKLPGN